MAAAVRHVMERPDLDEKQAAVNHVRQLQENAEIAANQDDRARRMANETAASGFMRRIILAQAGQGEMPTPQEIANDPRHSAARAMARDVCERRQTAQPSVWSRAGVD